MSENKTNSINDEKKNNKQKTVNRILTVIAIILLLLLGLKSCGSGKTNLNTDNSNNENPKWDISIGDEVGDIDKTEVDYDKIQEELNQKVAESSINISMNTHPTFENGKSKGNLNIVNEEINNFMQVVEIYRNDTNELIYTSSAIPVGKQLASDSLDVNLSKGEYKCTAYFNAIKDDGTYVGKAAAKITISVLN